MFFGIYRKRNLNIWVFMLKWVLCGSLSFPLGWRSDDLNTIVSAYLCNTKRDTFIGIIGKLSHLISFSPDSDFIFVSHLTSSREEGIGTHLSMKIQIFTFLFLYRYLDTKKHLLVKTAIRDIIGKIWTELKRKRKILTCKFHLPMYCFILRSYHTYLSLFSTSYLK